MAPYLKIHEEVRITDADIKEMGKDLRVEAAPTLAPEPWMALLWDCWYYYNKAPVIQTYDYGNAAGGCLHIVLDDGNLSKSNIEWCSGYASALNDDAAGALCGKLLKLKKKQRQKLYEHYHLYAYGAAEPEKYSE